MNEILTELKNILENNKDDKYGQIPDLLSYLINKRIKNNINRIEIIKLIAKQNGKK